jgi:RNA-directed DNA polymerase
MITDSPHLYRMLGEKVYRARGEKVEVSQEIMAASLLQAQRVEADGLVAVLTLNHLAYQTGASYSFLRDIVERTSDPYRDLSIRRRNGRKMREISIPDPVLMEVQRWILREILVKLPVHHSSYAYSEGRSILCCAEKHLGARWLVKLDIRDFFTSITEAQAYSIFRGAGYQPLISLELARICTRYAGHVEYVDEKRYRATPHYARITAYEKPLLGFLPQGAPTSGALANLVAHALDVKLTSLANDYGCVYTRYADDLTFSSIEDFTRDGALKVVRAARGVIRSERFVMHEQKTSIIPPGARKLVLGLLVDGDKVRMSRKLRVRIASHIRGVELFGLSQHVAHVRFSSIDGLVRHVSGLLAFAHDIEPEWAFREQARWHSALQQNGWIEIPTFHNLRT